MPEITPRVDTVVINTTDVEKLTDFWSQVLGVGVARQFPGLFVWLEPQHEGGISVAFQKVEDPTSGRNRLHLDTTVPDLETAKARIVELGGSEIESHEIAGFTWIVMADPDGNEFCIALGE